MQTRATEARPGSIEYYRAGCAAIDLRIKSVHVEGVNENPALKPGEVIITCFVTWRWFDVYWLRNRLNARVGAWIEQNKMVTDRIELRFVENFD